MKTVFISSLSIFLVLSNIIGMSNFRYKLNSDLLMEKSDSYILKCIEFLRLIILLSLTCAVLKLPPFYLRYVQIIRFWAIIFLAWLLKNRIITYGRVIITLS